MPAPKIAVLTLCIGADYKRNLESCIQSKRDYCAKHGYDFILGGEEWWDRSRPIAWSKMGFFIHHMKESILSGKYDYLWLSDADVYITNMDLKVEEHMLPLLPEGKDVLFCVDAFDHINSGNIFLRPTPRVIDWFDRVDHRDECVNHIWWENGAMLLEWRDSPQDLEWFEIYEADPTRFNAYLAGLPGKKTWTPGCFLVHFAGVYDAKKISGLVDEMRAGRMPSLGPI
jgi:hypothetical protein